MSTSFGPYLRSKMRDLEEEAAQCERNASTHEADAVRQRQQADNARRMLDYLRGNDALAAT